MRMVEAKYPEGLAMGRMLLLQLKAPYSSAPLISKKAAAFWSEHSGRATLPSLSALCPQFPPEWTDTLGRWRAQASQIYVRTQLYRTASIQEAIAKKSGAGPFRRSVTVNSTSCQRSRSSSSEKGSPPQKLHL